MNIIIRAPAYPYILEGNTVRLSRPIMKTAANTYILEGGRVKRQDS